MPLGCGPTLLAPPRPPHQTSPSRLGCCTCSTRQKHPAGERGGSGSSQRPEGWWCGFCVVSSCVPLGCGPTLLPPLSPSYQTSTSRLGCRTCQTRQRHPAGEVSRQQPEGQGFACGLWPPAAAGRQSLLSPAWHRSIAFTSRHLSTNPTAALSMVPTGAAASWSVHCLADKHCFASPVPGPTYTTTHAQRTCTSTRGATLLQVVSSAVPLHRVPRTTQHQHPNCKPQTCDPSPDLDGVRPKLSLLGSNLKPPSPKPGWLLSPSSTSSSPAMPLSPSIMLHSHQHLCMKRSARVATLLQALSSTPTRSTTRRTAPASPPPPLPY